MIPIGATAFTFAAIFLVIVVCLLVVIAIHILICYLLWSAQKRVPPQFRKIEPGLIWLLLIPIFPLVWNFFVYPKIAASYKAYFDSIGRTDVGACGGDLGLGYSIVFACSIVPYLGMLTGLAALILLILFLVKILDLKNQIPPVQ